MKKLLVLAAVAAMAMVQTAKAEFMYVTHVEVAVAFDDSVDKVDRATYESAYMLSASDLSSWDKTVEGIGDLVSAVKLPFKLDDWERFYWGGMEDYAESTLNSYSRIGSQQSDFAAIIVSESLNDAFAIECINYQYVYDPNWEDGICTLGLNFDNLSNPYGRGAEAVPEPTSGLLLLLGVAGLALKRRRV